MTIADVETLLIAKGYSLEWSEGTDRYLIRLADGSSKLLTASEVEALVS
jgi:hypothetical protein